MSTLQSFQILTYQPNPAFFQPNLPVLISPLPGYGGLGFAVTNGSLPSGLILDSRTGIISGSVVSVMDPVTLTITGTNSFGNWPCELIINITDQPTQAIPANQASATGLTTQKQFYESNFVASLQYLINQNNTQGKYTAVLEMPNLVSFRFVFEYLSPLGFRVVNLTPSQDDYLFTSFFGQNTSFPGPCYPDNFYNDFTQPYPLIVSRSARKVAISWSPYQGIRQFTYCY